MESNVKRTEKEQFIKYKYNELLDMNVGVIFEGLFGEDMGSMMLSNAGDFHSFVKDDNSYLNTKDHCKISLICYDMIGKQPYYLCREGERIYVLYGKISEGKMKVLYKYKLTHDKNESMIHEKAENEYFDVSKPLVYDDYCHAVSNALSHMVYSKLAELIPLYSIASENGYMYLLNKKDIYIGASSGMGKSWNAMVRLKDINESQSSYDSITKDYKNYILMLNIMYMALTDGKGNTMCDCITKDGQTRKALTTVWNGILSAVIADKKDSPLNESSLGVYDIGTCECVFISDEMRDLFEKFGYWFTPDIMAKLAFSLLSDK